MRFASVPPVRQRMPGVFEVPQGTPMGMIIEELLLLAECSFENEWEGQIIYLPLERHGLRPGAAVPPPRHR